MAVFSGNLGQRRKSHICHICLLFLVTKTTPLVCWGKAPFLLCHSLQSVFSWNFWLPFLLWGNHELILAVGIKVPPLTSSRLFCRLSLSYVKPDQNWDKKMCQSYGAQKFGSAAAQVCSVSRAGDVMVNLNPSKTDSHCKCSNWEQLHQQDFSFLKWLVFLFPPFYLIPLPLLSFSFNRLGLQPRICEPRDDQRPPAPTSEWCSDPHVWTSSNDTVCLHSQPGQTGLCQGHEVLLLNTTVIQASCVEGKEKKNM